VGLTHFEEKVMEIFLSVISVMVAMGCLTGLLVTDAREYRKQAAINRLSSKLKNAQAHQGR